MAKDDAQHQLREALNLELRRGAVILAVLSQLTTEHYGYSLKRRLNEKGFTIDEGTLYPLMRRLETQGLLASSWRIEDGRPRRYYQLSDAGVRIFEELRTDWKHLADTMGGLLR
ncbi:MAG: PadR family transcriptional regulator [Acidobacteria bacterium]|nr:MAG: PadR family transcriptional regulator [Acidobacteriota bacterium]